VSSLKFGDIYLTRFHPAYGHELKRYRPAVIASHQTNKIDSRFTTICPLSTQIKKHLPNFELVLDKNTAGLDHKSVLISWYIRTIDVDRLETQIGTLAKDDRIKFKHQLTNLFS
jgi:mRNA interferase MazF